MTEQVSAEDKDAIDPGATGGKSEGPGKESGAHAHEHVHGPGCDHDHPTQEPARRQVAKVGRNDPCSCGSGKKYKKCCG